MTLQSLTEKVVKKAIRSAACIDDEYLSPYEELKPGLNKERPAELYDSFRRDANCDIDIYHYESFDKWSVDKEFVLNSKDLLILDWELDKELQIKYKNTIKILEDALNSPFIYYIVIHTHTKEAELIYKNLLYNFYYNNKIFDSDTYTILIDDLIERIYTRIKDDSSISLDLDEFDEMVDEFKNGILSLVNGFTYNLSKREEIKSQFYLFINKTFGISKSERIVNKTIEYGNYEPDAFFCLLEMFEYFESFERFINDKDREYNIKEIKGTDSPNLFINNTLITIFAKESAVESTLPKVSVKDVFVSLTNCINRLPNNSLSSIIALELKDLYRQNLAAFGKGLAGIDERALIHHLNKYSTINEKYEYLLQVWNNQVNILTILRSDPMNLPTSEHFKVHADIQVKNIEKELVEFISNVMLLPRFSKNNDRLIQFGDIFKTEKPLRLIKKNGTDDPNYEYLLCITPVCDCARPEKINNNFSFLYGKTVNPNSALKHTETNFYTFLHDIVIEWSNNPFTLFLENSKIESIICNSIRYNDITLKIEYISSMKELFTQRIANHAFSNNIRIGLDLPHTSKK